MKIVLDGDFGCAVGEVQGGKALLLTDAKTGLELQVFFNNESAEIVGKALANTGIVIPQGADVMKLVKSKQQ